MCTDDFDWYISWKIPTSWDGTLGRSRCDCGHRFFPGEAVLRFGGIEHTSFDVDGIGYWWSDECMWCGADDYADGRLLIQDDYGNAISHSALACHICRDNPEETLGIQHAEIMCERCQHGARWLDKACQGLFVFGDITAQLADHYSDGYDEASGYPATAMLAGWARQGWRGPGGHVITTKAVSTLADRAIKELAVVA